mmetsp:Transcript_72017/g.204420  ORF Transcript_72017/g.204420 Transcript_72017/m.204420 type:complete len:131 (-) Transcript_72017:904-1296(-)
MASANPLSHHRCYLQIHICKAAEQDATHYIDPKSGQVVGVNHVTATLLEDDTQPAAGPMEPALEEQRVRDPQAFVCQALWCEGCLLGPKEPRVRGALIALAACSWRRAGQLFDELLHQPHFVPSQQFNVT